jgi:hypothetical protein
MLSVVFFIIMRNAEYLYAECAVSGTTILGYLKKIIIPDFVSSTPANKAVTAKLEIDWTGKTTWRGRVSTLDLLIKVACFVKGE